VAEVKHEAYVTYKPPSQLTSLPVSSENQGLSVCF